MHRLAVGLTAGLMLVPTLAPPGAAAQDWLLVQGSLEGEGWLTDDGSRLLARNGGDPAPVGHLYLWGAAELARGVQLYTVTEFEAGYPDQTKEGSWAAEVEQLALRLSWSRHLVVDAGRITSPVGTFAPRRFAAENSVIGVPDLYPVSYPEGIQLSGMAGAFDYRAAAVNLPVINEKYVPATTRAWRPALGGRVTPFVGLRLGTSYTWGPYLNDDLGAALPALAPWDDYEQRALGFDARFSRGYLETWPEVSLSSYDVPDGVGGGTRRIDGTAYFLEARYTWTPRFFTAARFEMNDYAFIRPGADPASWTARAVKFHDGEIGVGYRLGARTLAKASFRKDWWDVTEAQRTFLPDGYAVAVQLYWGFDLLPWSGRGY